jgi:hypothetical protein
VTLLSSDHASTTIEVDPYLGMLCIGLHGASQRVRAIDQLSQRVLWEAPAEIQVSDTGKCVTICGGRAYIVNDTAVWAVDLYSGRMIFRTMLESGVQCGFGQPNLWDSCHPSSPGTLVVQTVQDQYVGLERGFGSTLWKIEDAKDMGPVAVPGGVVICAFDGTQLSTMLIDPSRGPSPLFKLPSSEVKVRSAGHNVLFGAHELDADASTAGVAVVQMPTGRVLLHANAPFDIKRGAPVACGRFVYSADLFRLAASPMGPSAEGELVPGYAIERLEATYAIVVALLGEMSGAHKYKLVGLDPNTLKVWYTIETDLGCGSRTQEDVEPLAALGPFVAIAGRHGENETIFTVIHADTGRVGWQHVAKGSPERVSGEGNYFVLRTTRQTLLYRPDLPQQAPVAVFG